MLLTQHSRHQIYIKVSSSYLIFTLDPSNHVVSNRNELNSRPNYIVRISSRIVAEISSNDFSDL